MLHCFNFTNNKAKSEQWRKQFPLHLLLHFAPAYTGVLTISIAKIKILGTGKQGGVNSRVSIEAFEQQSREFQSDSWSGPQAGVEGLPWAPMGEGLPPKTILEVPLLTAFAETMALVLWSGCGLLNALLNVRGPGAHVAMAGESVVCHSGAGGPHLLSLRPFPSAAHEY